MSIPLQKNWIVPQAVRQVLVAQLHSGSEQSSNLICDTKINLHWGPLAVYTNVVIKIKVGWGHLLYAGVIGVDEWLAIGSVTKKGLYS